MNEPQRKCDQCGKSFTLTPAAPHKRFCSDECRSRWHNERRKEGLAELEKRRKVG